MAENIPNIPTGAVPPKKETGKVQPKKETVRINLPPKPSAAPTIKLPTLPPGGPSASSAAPAPALSTSATPHATAAPASAPRLGTAAPLASRTSAPSVPSAPRPATMIPVPTVSGLDKALALVAAIIGLAAVGATVYMIYGLPN